MNKQDIDEVLKIKDAVFDVIPLNVDKMNIIIALAELQRIFAELILEDDPQE